MKNERFSKFLPLVLVLSITMLCAACLHKAGHAKISPWERAMSENAIFSQIVHDAPAGIIQVQNAGLATAADVKEILEYFEDAAKVHQQVNLILAQGPGAASSSTQLDTLLNQVTASGQTVVKSGAAGLKNPKTQQTIAADIRQLMTLAQAILHDVRLAKTGSLQPETVVLAAGGLAPLGSPAGIAALIEALLALGPLAVATFLKIESYLNLGPDEKQNVADMLAASNANDADTVAMIEQWKQANGFSTATPPPPPQAPGS